MILHSMGAASLAQTLAMPWKTPLLALLLVLGPSCSAADGSSSSAVPPQAGLDGSANDAAIETPDAPVLDDVLSEVSIEPEASIDSTVADPCESSDEWRFACCTFSAVNDYRTSQGLAALLWDPQVAIAAEWYSQYMADLGLLEHQLDGRKVGTRLTDFGIDWTAAGENIAANTTDAWQDSCVQVFEQWYGSPLHHALMVSSKYTHGAVGVARGDGWWYATLNVVAY